MARSVPVAAAAALLYYCAWAQPAANTPRFEVASVKPAPQPEGLNQSWTAQMHGGPGSADPTRIDYLNVTLASLIARACGVVDYQISGPDWIRSEHYDVAAKVPPGATREEFKLMLATLLAERFKFQFHRETKEMPLYSLTVAKGGSKLKPHVETAHPAEEHQPSGPGPLKKDANGFPILTGKSGSASAAGKNAWRTEDASLDILVGIIAAELKTPVNDDTGLSGRYDMELRWVPQRYLLYDVKDGPDIFTAVRTQLGLSLEKKKGPAETLVIDHAEKVPTGN